MLSAGVVPSTPAAVIGARGPSGNNRSGALGTGHRCVTTTEQSLDFPVVCTRQVTVTATHNHSEAKRIFCGVDVSSQFLDVQVGRDGARAQYSNDEEGIKQLAAFCRSHAVDVVAMEASGGYEQ